MLELILEHPGTVDAAIGITQTIEKTGMSLGAISVVHGKQPAQPFDRFASLGVVLLTYLVERFVSGPSRRGNGL